MDSLITAAARALTAGDPLAALNQVALRDDAAALAMRGIALAQLGDLPRAGALLKAAARAFGKKEALARARCVVAQAEIALASRDLGWSEQPLEAARSTLEKHGERINAAHARHIRIRRQLLLGRLDEAERGLAGIDPSSYPPPLQAAHELVIAGIALRRLQTRRARSAFARADTAARQSGIPALIAEVEQTALTLTVPAARLIHKGRQRTLLLEEVETLLASNTLIVDECRHQVRSGGTSIPFVGRPILLALARMLAEAWPEDVPRDVLIEKVFRTRFADDSHRARLRVEIGRLRQRLRGHVGIKATRRGFTLAPEPGADVAVLAPPVDEKHAAILALLADGQAWSSSALALALGTSQRTVQRALESLAQAEKVQRFGQGRARRWLLPPIPGFTTTLLLPAPLPGS
ncbi:hypothetical protein B5T_03643 [Alloalcanivorax dieselolei B5]|uniref:OmpR/PhoB-type domain-containing protein n=1 Tax=Alcanivorax dieselolei (strain DSM 16502 / CGMCC 1.3690 / MCCC 1A00001 / B-5) TaxID=930169 RepID=K0CJI5_ALCDB|nr:hypothetical protein [Alloalcanivorax dieselolei]AFT71907.1 hypothetical protein B5T_03643 [Alloalcanivorax dieselolei B5]GGK08909.1 hypothetical protein GCM10007426_41450 [Alloalcanivorax dieselolei]